MPTPSVDPNVTLVRERWEKCDDALIEQRRQFWLNLAFFQGRQWLYWDYTRRIPQDVTNDRADNERVRVTVNQLRPRLEGLLGRLSQRPLQFEVPPSDVDDSSIAGARLSERILEHVHREQGWEGVRMENLLNTILGGTAAVVIDWDGQAGERLWWDEHNNAVGTGDVNLVPFSIGEFSLEPYVRRAEDANWWIAAMAMSPDAAQAKFNLDYKPEPDASSEYRAIQRRYTQEKLSGKADLCVVYVLYERPNKNCPQGRRLVVVSGKTVIDDEWPFTTDRLNIEVFHQTKVPGTWTGETFFTDARKIQVVYNHAQSVIAEHLKLAGNARLFVPRGSIADLDVLSDEAGEIVEYVSWGDGAMPQWQTPAPLQRWTTEYPDRLEAMLDEVMHTHAVARGQAPGDRNSGLALSILAEKDDTPLGPLAHAQALKWGAIGSNVLRQYAEKVNEKRSAKVEIGDGVPQDFQWNGAMLAGQTTVRVPLENTMPTSKAATIAQAIQVAGAFPQIVANLPAEKALKMTGMSTIDDMDDIIDAHVAKARHENAQLTAGLVPFPEHWHDHAKHIAEHNELRNQKVFESFDAEQRLAADTHIAVHERMAGEIAAAQATINAVQPGLAALPQGHGQMGSAVPDPHSMRSAPQGA